MLEIGQGFSATLLFYSNSYALCIVLVNRWDTDVGGTVLSSQFLSLSTRLPSHYVYGFGENVHQTFRHDVNYRTWGMFARDEFVGHGVSRTYRL